MTTVIQRERELWLHLADHLELTPPDDLHQIDWSATDEGERRRCDEAERSVRAALYRRARNPARGKRRQRVAGR